MSETQTAFAMAVEPLGFPVLTTRYHAFHRGAQPEHEGVPLVPVRTSAGNPRFITESAQWPRCNEIVPWGLTKINDKGEFVARYRERLEKHGAEKIHARLTEIHHENDGRPLALLCFEDLEQPGIWCHRRAFAAWWLEQAGEVIPELGAESGAAPLF
jgi:hypothetical protein